MSVFMPSVAPSPFSSITQVERMDQAASKFTAVNNSQEIGAEPTRSFAFRPDSSVTILANGQSSRESAGAGTPKQAPSTQEPAFRPSTSPHGPVTNLPDAQGLYDNIDVGSSTKRRRSSHDTADEGRRPAPSDASPARLAEQANRYIDEQRNQHEYASPSTKPEPADTPMLERPLDSFGASGADQKTRERSQTDPGRPPLEDQDLVASVNRDMKRYTATSPEAEGTSSPEVSPPLDDARQSSLFGPRPSSNEDTPPNIEKKKRQFTRRTKTGCL